MQKHGLDLTDADLVLENECLLIVESPRKDDARLQAFAYVFEVLAVLRVAFAISNERRRIMSFRPAKRAEREKYHAWPKEDYREDQ